MPDNILTPPKAQIPQADRAKNEADVRIAIDRVRKRFAEDRVKRQPKRGKQRE